MSTAAAMIKHDKTSVAQIVADDVGEYLKIYSTVIPISAPFMYLYNFVSLM